MNSYPTTEVYNAIALSLREFGYPDAKASMIMGTYNAMNEGRKEADLPHGVIGRFAYSQILDAVKRGLLKPFDTDVHEDEI
jgi:hypothetical protein